MPQKVIKTVDKPNYIVKDFKNPPKKDIIGYRTKTIIDKEGKKHLVRLALVKDKKTGKIKTKATSIWHKKSINENVMEVLARRFINDYFISRTGFI